MAKNIWRYQVCYIYLFQWWCFSF